jgi:uncharacterized protein (TIGR03085 family)
MPSHSAAERAVLADALTEAGPQGPTLCDGWTTRELAVHLVVREGRPDLGLAGRVPGLSGLVARTVRGIGARPYLDLVETFRAGPPRLSPVALPGVDARLNLAEHFVHAEDVLRARPGWEPRDLPARRQDALWSFLTTMGRVVFRASPGPVVLRTPDGRTHPVGPRPGAGAGPAVEVIGEPAEILLYGFGRQDHSRVQLEGPDPAVAAFREVPFVAWNITTSLIERSRPRRAGSP